ncbi:cytochrome c biogenesis protein [Blattabacterium cuenoti]|uniref:cytochrome c biogenesis protein n=1 Tax=Blattabacterium cuenoti TaxID=1653831 RepID=UPI001EE9D0F7|nr:cytochrome c biogenesis protein CcsA [Blattabacterium cuenoti]
MIKILKNIFFSLKSTSVLFLLLAFTMAIATFLEKKFSTDFAKVFVYEAKWFEFLMLLFLINLIVNICKYKLWSKKKLPVLIFHLSFIFIFIGGIFSRYLSFEGIMSIKEGETNNKVYSQKKYIKVYANKSSFIRSYYDPYILTSFHNNYENKFLFKGDPITVKVIKYIPCAKLIFSKKKEKYKVIKIISTNNNERIENFIKDGEFLRINGIPFSLNNETFFGINIFEKNKKLYINSSFSGKCIDMINGISTPLQKNRPSILGIRKLYQIKINKITTIVFVIPEGIINGELKYIPSLSCENEGKEKNYNPNVITAMISFKKKKKLVTFLSGENIMSPIVNIDNCKISIGYGPMFLNLPFSLRLNKFKIENYPGSDFPSFFISKITLIDKNNKKNYSIYMNNVLNYKGYRFFQSGYNIDKKGTYLTVNNDYMGTYFSYAGYLLMSIGIILTFFWKNTRFYNLRKKLNSLSRQKFLFIIIFLIINNSGIKNIIYSHNNEHIHEKKKITIENISNVINIPKNHSEKFGKLLVQDYQGRIKPINTTAIDLLRKIYKKDTIGGIDANQWFISIHQNNFFWSRIPFIKVNKKGGSKFLKKIKANNKYYVSIMNLYDFDTKTLEIKFILKDDYHIAFSKNPMIRNEYDKAVINLSERIGIIHGIFQGKYIRIFPIPNDKNNTWNSWTSLDIKKINNIGLLMLNNYMKALQRSQYEKNWNLADNEIKKIKLYQIKYGKSVIPTDTKISMEILYNKLNIFYYISFLYAFIGIIIIINSFVSFFLKKDKIIHNVYKILFLLLSILFVIETLGLISRWYISNHAPWSNGYESAIFISWCIIVIGLIFHKYKIVSGITSLGSFILLMLANGSIMDPEITNLVPVLKSHWLIMHVAIITSSYGFFFTGSFLGFLVLILYIIRKYFHLYNEKIQKNIDILTIINELCVTIGIFLLTVGTFLGSIWANNSWGRYWSWDPKETWALISIMIYAFVLHIRLIPGVKSSFFFNFFSVLSIFSIIMTYFGVNYYLSGLHSYAKGDPIVIPKWIFYITCILLIIGFFSYYSNKHINISKHSNSYKRINNK